MYAILSFMPSDELSDEKTLITYAQNAAKFLGYEVSIRKSKEMRRNRNGVLRRPFNGRIVLRVANEVVKKKLLDYSAISVGQNNGVKGFLWKAIVEANDHGARSFFLVPATFDDCFLGVSEAGVDQI